MNSCPDCQNQLVFSGDGRDRICERCGYRQPVAGRPEESIADLIRLRRAMAGSRPEGRSLRLMLRRGIGEVRDGRPESAASLLKQVILKTGDPDEEVEAWVWLSRLTEDPGDRRLCLEKALAINPANGEARRELAILDGRIDADALRSARTGDAAGGDPIQGEAGRMQCPRCAGDMAFQATSGRLHCPFCGHEEDTHEAIDLDRDEQFGRGALEQDFDAAIHTVRGHTRPESIRVFSCQGCGAPFTLAPETLSLTCPYCSAVYVTEAAETAELIVPQAVIPFRLTLDDARQAVAAWFHRRKIKRSAITTLSPLVGIYLPVWTFDIGGEVRWQGQVQLPDGMAGSYRSAPVSSARYVHFDDFLLPATDRPGAQFAGLIETYDFSELVPYDPQLLAAWPAERYSVEVGKAAAIARGQVGRALRSRPHGLDGGSDLDPATIRCQTDGLVVESYKLLLVPVWTFHYRLSGAMHDLLINGQNGRAAGREIETGPAARFLAWLKNLG